MDAENTRPENAEENGGGGISRKTLLKAALVAVPAAPLLVGRATAPASAVTDGPLPLTPACDDGDAPTIEQIEGPYFKPGSPLRTSLAGPGTPGVPLTVSGYVFGRSCRPIAGALLDFWQADNNGAYDNTGYTFRGHQFSDAQGAFRLTTIVPGLYPGRTRHIHVKVQAPNGPVLTTQLYFPGEPRNNTDTIYNPALLMTVRTVGSGREATFDFVLNVNAPNPSPTPTPTSTITPPPNGGGTWQAGTNYRAGDQVTYGGVTYRCIQAHTAYAGWEPPNVPALWQRV
ncbi:dioxygenase family protein [Streptosporangium pseudovulgare]|uniref:dioxygenase family protein n=1 Tax=Streptosporangium pseudovulgare TaxID=35765 RepID=UPI001E35BEF1|nr:carbohydrate-binding protein [Streptosporangium pseudovulgare]